MRWSEHFTKNMGDTAVGALRHFQRSRGLKADGVYGEATHRKLRRYFDAYGAHLMRSYVQRPGESRQRAIIVSWAIFSYHNAPRHYSQLPAARAPYYRHTRPPDMWYSADCSGFALWCLWGAGVPTSACGPYDGWTGSMQEHGRVVSLRDAKPGDMVFYHNHVAVYVGNNRIVSHGHEGGPFLVNVWYRSDLREVRSYV